MVQHVKGETCIPLDPKRIVTLDFNSFSSVLALDIKPVATWITTEIEDDFHYFEGRIDGIEILRSPTGQPNLEKLIKIKPDLIFVISHPIFDGIYKQLPLIAPTVVLPWIETKADWKQHLKDTARVLEKNETASKLMADYDLRVKHLTKLLQNHPLPRVSFLYIAAGQLVITRQKSFAGGILNDVGLLNPIFGGNGYLDLSISEELFPEIDSDVLFISPLRKDDSSAIKYISLKPLWSRLRAVQNNQVYPVDFSVWRGNNILAAHEVIDDLYEYLINRPPQGEGDVRDRSTTIRLEALQSK